MGVHPNKVGPPENHQIVKVLNSKTAGTSQGLGVAV